VGIYTTYIVIKSVCISVRYTEKTQDNQLNKGGLD